MTEDAEKSAPVEAATDGRPAARWMRFLARAISGLWAGFWIFFAVASSAEDFNRRGGASLGGLLIPLAFSVILLLVAFTAWRWERVGRIALPAAGLAVFILYPIAAKNFTVPTKMFVMATLGLPPLSAGILLVAADRIARIPGAKRQTGA